MENIIEILREIQTELDFKKEKYSTTHTVDDELYEEIKKTIYSMPYEVVDYSLDSGGRWSNIQTKVYKIKEGNKEAYFELYEEIPATELQESNDYSYEFKEVEPYEVTITQYKIKGDN